jgi:hypothetical protein
MSAADARRVHIVKSDPPETTEILAEAIVRIGEAADKLKSSGLNRKAIVLLLHDATKVGKKDIDAILNALPRLRGWYCR